MCSESGSLRWHLAASLVLQDEKNQCVSSSFFSPFSACSFRNMKGFPCSPAPLIVFLETTTLIGVFFLFYPLIKKIDVFFYSPATRVP